MKPREWWDSLPSGSSITLEEAEDRGYYCFDLRPFFRNKTDCLCAVNDMLDVEDAMGIHRKDWIYLNCHLVFTTADIAVHFRLTMNYEQTKTH